MEISLKKREAQTGSGETATKDSEGDEFAAKTSEGDEYAAFRSRFSHGRVPATRRRAA